MSASLPSARLALRVVADTEGVGLAAQWLDDQSGLPRLMIVARRHSPRPWLVPPRGMPDDQLALGLLALLEALRTAPAERASMDAPHAGRQQGLAWPQPMAIDYDPLDPLYPGTFTATIFDPAWESVDAMRAKMSDLADRIRGERPERRQTTPPTALLLVGESAATASTALVLAELAHSPESTLSPANADRLARPR